jgi:hypothetical protein
MRREDFVFCIGYEGNAAIVDGRLRARYAGYSTKPLAEAGLYKQAICSAYWSKKPEELEEILQIYNARTEHPVSSVAELSRIYGVSGFPQGVAKVTVI